MGTATVSAYAAGDDKFRGPSAPARAGRTGTSGYPHGKCFACKAFREILHFPLGNSSGSFEAQPSQLPRGK